MPPTLNKTHECQIIRKIISNCENADKVIEAFKEFIIPPQDIGEIVRFDDEQIKDREYQECHDTARRWLADWANLGASQTRQMVMPFLHSVPVGPPVSQYQHTSTNNKHDNYR